MNKKSHDLDIKYIVVIDYFDSWSFFKRLLKDIPKDRIVVVTNLLSVKKISVKDGFKCDVIKKSALVKNLPLDALSATREVAAKDISLSSAFQYYSAIFNSIESYCINSNIKTKILTWNGTDIKGLVIRSIESKYPTTVSCVFYEITNFPGFVFADNKGVNAASSAFITPEVYQNVKLTKQPQYYENIVQNLVESKINSKIPQTNLSKKISIRHFLDYLYCHTLGLSNFSTLASLSKLINKLTSRRLLDVPNSLLLNEIKDTNNFSFFPMQVSSDSQLLINYQGGVMDSLEEALTIANAENLPLYIKLHPAENNKNIIKEIIDYCESNKIKILNIDTNKIIEKSKLVITVNSTIGFESLLINKKVIFIGASQYGKIKTRENLYKYLNYYFYHADFFSEDVININARRDLLDV